MVINQLGIMVEEIVCINPYETSTGIAGRVGKRGRKRWSCECLREMEFSLPWEKKEERTREQLV